MARVGTSAREPLKLGEYDIFLSFRGLDTRNNFTSCLYHDLVGVGFRVFRDEEELSRGKYIGSELLRAIDNSRICMPILSPNFATSAWCLREVAHMVQRSQKSGGALEIWPIFYNVGVDNIKLKTGSTYEVHINGHRDRFEEVVLMQWRDALKEVARIKGPSLNDNSDHGELIKSIVRDVSVRLNINYRNLPSKLVGVHQADAIMELINADAEGVRFIIIHGMGGMGKTTLAQLVFNWLKNNYDKSSFLDNIGELSKRHGLLYLQKKLLSDIFNPEYANNIKDVNDGTNQIRTRLSLKKVLIVLDDVDDEDQLKNLARESDWFGTGSRIIITTRDRGVLSTRGERDKYFHYGVEQMKDNDALRLFSWHAFRTDYPPNDYVGRSREMVSAMAALPLALEVIGSDLSCKCLGTCECQEIWEETLDELRRLPDKKVEETLMISINKLNDNQRNIYLDIACFLISEDQTNAIYMWSDCKLSPRKVIKSLIEKSLIKIDDNKFQMHDQLRDLGRAIVHRENKNPRWRSRVWNHQEAKEIVKKKQGTEAIEVLFLDSDYFILTDDTSKNLENLRLLMLQGQFTGDFENLLPNLRWLCWHDLSSNFKATNFYPSNLVVLELWYFNITEDWEGWKQLKVANKLKVLDLTGCKRLTRTPDLSSFSHLERLILKNCEGLIVIDPSIDKLGKLSYLNMEGCYSLRGLPEEIGSLTSLTTIIITGRRKEFKLPYSLGNLRSLTSLRIEEVSIDELPESIGKLTNLNHLSLNWCRRLKKLPDSIGNLEFLIKLDIRGSTGITELPNSIGNLKSLKEINMSLTGIRRLPVALGLLKCLQEIHAADCPTLEGEIPMEIWGLPSLKILDLRNCSINGIPKSIDEASYLKELHLGFSEEFEITDLRWVSKLSKLEKFSIESEHITTVGVELASLDRLQHLALDCAKLLCLLKLPSGLKSLTIKGLIDESRTLPKDGLSLGVVVPCLGELQMLRTLRLESCDFCDLNGLKLLRNLRSLLIEGYRKRLPDLYYLENLISLRLDRCDGLVEIPGLGKLQLLQDLRIDGCNSLEALHGLSNLMNLKFLVIRECNELRNVQGLDKLTSLISLSIEHCRSLETLPDMSALLNSQLSLLSICSCGNLPNQKRISNLALYEDLLFKKDEDF